MEFVNWEMVKGPGLLNLQYAFTLAFPVKGDWTNPKENPGLLTFGVRTWWNNFWIHNNLHARLVAGKRLNNEASLYDLTAEVVRVDNRTACKPFTIEVEGYSALKRGGTYVQLPPSLGERGYDQFIPGQLVTPVGQVGYPMTMYRIEKARPDGAFDLLQILFRQVSDYTSEEPQAKWRLATSRGAFSVPSELSLATEGSIDLWREWYAGGFEAGSEKLDISSLGPDKGFTLALPDDAV